MKTFKHLAILIILAILFHIAFTEGTPRMNKKKKWKGKKKGVKKVGKGVSKVADNVKKNPCESGQKYTDIIESGTCTYGNLPREACKKRFGGRFSDDTSFGKIVPSGCIKTPGGNKNLGVVRFKGSKSKYKCTSMHKCICKEKQCVNCRIGEITTKNQGCKLCPPGFYANSRKTKCISMKKVNDKLRSYVLRFENQTDKHVQLLQNSLDKQKETQQTDRIKTDRLWQKEEIRMQYNEMMDKREEKDAKDYKKECESVKVIRVFPAIPISDEIELTNDANCIGENRVQLLKAFCAFRNDLDVFLMEAGFLTKGESAQSYFPNICCKERKKDGKLNVCEDSSIEPKDMIPFAQAQGGKADFHSLYVEVNNTIKRNGHLHKGINDIITRIGITDKFFKERIDAFFDDISPCGPHFVDSPVGDGKLCEMFIPYEHSMKKFLSMLEDGSRVTHPSFLETMEQKLHNRQYAYSSKVNNNNKMRSVMQAKPAPPPSPKCKKGTEFGPSELKKKKQKFCKGHNHLDLSDETSKNLALYYLYKDIKYTDRQMVRLIPRLRFDVEDKSCKSPLFKAEHISVQQVSIETREKKWAAIVNLNTKDGYLPHEAQHCENRDYLIESKVIVKVYEDTENCCPWEKDYNECLPGCRDRMKTVKNRYHEQFKKEVSVIGTTYKVKDPFSGRRKLLQATSGRGQS
eukprot:g6627.t1